LIEENTLAESGKTGDCVFFYGTLLPRHTPPAMRSVVPWLRLLGEGSVRGALYDFGEYPGAVLADSSEQRVYGAVFELPEGPRILDDLDRYEGYDAASPSSCLFVRRRHPVALSADGVIECWVYEYNGNPANARIIESGRYGKDDPADR